MFIFSKKYSVVGKNTNHETKMATTQAKHNLSDEAPEKNKKIKLNEEENTENSVHLSLNDLSKFKVDKILHNNTNRKSICVQGSFESCKGVALILLEKPAFSEDSFTEKNNYFTEENTLKKVFHNDIYGNYEYYPKINLNCKLVEYPKPCNIR